MTSENCQVGKIALIYGITGQDGAWLAKLLLQKGYVVHGVVRKSSTLHTFNTERMEELGIYDDIKGNLHYGDVSDAMSVISMVQSINPSEIYNLAAMSHVHVSFQQPHSTAAIDALGPLNILEAIRLLGKTKTCKMYQASTSEMFGGSKEDYTSEEWELIETNGMNEKTRMIPKSPYGAAKLFAHAMLDVYRKSYGIFAVGGICFNHESELRDPRFVTRKVTIGVAQYHLGRLKFPLQMGNLNAQRDWGYAPDYVESMYMALQHESPKDYVLSTGHPYSVRYMIEIAFSSCGYSVEWKGTDLQEKGYIKNPDGSEDVVVEINEKFYRPNEVDYLKGDSSLALKTLNWQPMMKFEDMMNKMVKRDIEHLSETK